jgi:hypothetical protein
VFGGLVAGVPVSKVRELFLSLEFVAGASEKQVPSASLRAGSSSGFGAKDAPNSAWDDTSYCGANA